MRKMTVKQVAYVQGIIDHLLEYAERTENERMEKDITILSDILNNTAFHMDKPKVKEPAVTGKAQDTGIEYDYFGDPEGPSLRLRR